MRPLVVLLVGIVLSASSIVWLNASGRIGRHDGVPERAFNSKEWIVGDRRVRGAMVDRLEQKGLLLGRDKSAVISMLGLPDDPDTTGCTFEYAVDIGLRTGPIGLGGTWPFHMAVHFDSVSGRAVEVATRD